MGIAVVDLTISSRTGPSPGFISYGGADDNIERYAGSMPKIAAMYAGYRLRERLNNAAGALAATKADDVFAEVEAAWKPVISTAYPKKPPDFPKLKRIFKVIGGPGAWTFAFTNSNMDWNTLNGLHEHALPAGMGFRDRMKLSIGWSDNDATGSLVEDLGRQYINGALAAENLYDRTSNKELWLNNNYDNIANNI